MKAMKASQSCVLLIKASEGLYLVAYLCPANIWTIGWGHTSNVHEGMVISADQAETLLQFDIARVESELLRILPSGVALTQGQWDALVSLSFNLKGGPAALPHKAPHLWADLVAGHKAEAAHEFLDMDHANGHELGGLKLRREKEAALYVS